MRSGNGIVWKRKGDLHSAEKNEKSAPLETTSIMQRLHAMFTFVTFLRF